jgi:hypothetical protein
MIFPAGGDVDAVVDGIPVYASQEYVDELLVDVN